MSEVISFRLNKGNLREAKALLVLQEWRAQGYSIRRIITDALLKLDATQTEPHTNRLDELNDTLNQVNLLLKQLSYGDSAQSSNTDGRPENSRLADHFVASIKKSAKRGTKIS